MDIETIFKIELEQLLRKYQVDMSIEGDYEGMATINFYRYSKNIDEHIDWNTRWLDGKDIV